MTTDLGTIYGFWPVPTDSVAVLVGGALAAVVMYLVVWVRHYGED